MRLLVHLRSPLEVTTISRLVVLAGNHSILVTQLTHGKRAGRYALAYNFFARWRFVTDVDTDELLTWKTEEEALIIGEAWRQAWESIYMPHLEPQRATAHARSMCG
jgi:hypothetical protein